jgi:hypothetical protein
MKKTFLSYESNGKKLRRIGKNVEFDEEYALIAKLKDDGETFYASSFDSTIEKRIGQNHRSEVKQISLQKQKGRGKVLSIILNDEKEIQLDNNEFVLVFCRLEAKKCDGEDLLLYNFPNLLSGKISECPIPSEDGGGSAIELFWLLKEFFN